MAGEIQDDQRLLEIYRVHRRALVDYAASIVGGRAQAEDVVQDAYVRFAALRNKSDEAGTVQQPLGYFRRIVRNIAVDWIRRRALEKHAFPDGASFEDVPASAPTPEQHVLYTRELRIVAEALAELPERTRRAFKMYRLDGKTFHEVAAALGISIGLAHRLVREAMTHCAARLDRPPSS